MVFSSNWINGWTRMHFFDCVIAGRSRADEGRCETSDFLACQRGDRLRLKRSAHSAEKLIAAATQQH
jgi:hypothetical protein